MSETESQLPRKPMGGARRLATRALFAAYQRTYGLPIERQLAELNTSQYWSRAELDACRTDGLQRHLVYAYRHSPYWHETLKGVGYSEKTPPLEVLQRLPIMDKTVYRRERERMMVPDYCGRRMREISGGSTGEPVEYPMDTVSSARIKANLFRKWSWAGYHLGEPWVWLKTSLHDHLMAKLRDAAFNCTYHSVVRSDPVALEALLRRLAGQRFALLRSYPSAMRKLAEVAQNAGINNVQTRNVTTTGETLLPRDRALIESTFRCRLFDTYGGDCFSIAGQCEQGTYHVNDESVWIEIVDDDGNPLPAGETGHVVLSEFHNILMPMFRWRIGDRARLSGGTCPCGRNLSILGGIEGRDSDIVKLPNGAELCMPFFSPVLSEENGVRQYQVVQEKVAEIHVRLVVTERYDTAAMEVCVRERLRQTGGDIVHVEFEYVDDIPQTRAGKERVIISRVIERQERGG